MAPSNLRADWNRTSVAGERFVKRSFDLVIVIVLLAILAIPLTFLAIAVRASSPGPVLYWSKRVGRGNRLFSMPKFRSMRVDAPVVATHLLEDPSRWLTRTGSFLRKTSLDELPQLWSILRGEMSFVGPRPALFNQQDLIEARTSVGVHLLRPGLTGWAQIHGRDEISVAEKVALDTHYLAHRSMRLDFYIIALTALQVLRRDGVSH